MLMIAQSIPYLAFAAAALLLGWVAVDMLRAHVRKPRLAPVLPPAPERGLASPPMPISARLPIATVHDTELVIPTSQAQDLEEQPQAAESAIQETVPSITIDANSERREAATSAILYNDPVVRRDPSVRVYDAVVAPSERHTV
jgi:hypothetical protein